MMLALCFRQGSGVPHLNIVKRVLSRVADSSGKEVGLGMKPPPARPTPDASTPLTPHPSTAFVTLLT